MEASEHRIEATKVIGEAFSTYQSQAAPLLGGALIVVGISSVIDLLLGLTGSLWLVLAGIAVGLIGQVLYTGYVVKLVEDVRDGRLDQTMGELFSAAAPYIGTLILNGIIYGIAVACGFFLLIVPGLFLITIWAVVAPSIVAEDRGVGEAFGRSRELVRGNGWNVFFTILLAFLILVVVSTVFAFIGATIGDAGRVILGTVGNILVVPVAALVASILFFDLGGGAVSATAEPVPPAP
jgi:ABC-type multidrug transport system fused ATPase/permease subunit